MIGRRKKPSPLPARVYEKHGSWWFVDTNRKWHRLCRVTDGIVRLYERLAAFTRESDSSSRALNTMPALVDDWMAVKLSGYSAKTRGQYQRMAHFIKSEFGPQWLIEDVRPADIARFLDKHFATKPNTANKYKALMSLLFVHAVRKGLRDRNPAREVEGAKEKKRDRYITDDELDAIRAAALVDNHRRPAASGRTLVCLIDLAYQTAQRFGDLLALNWQNVSEEGVYFHPSKTVNSSGVRLLIEMTPDLRATLDAAKAGKIKAIGPVICTHAGGRYTYIGAQSAWRRAIERARKWYEEECANATPPRAADPMFLNGMHFHDLRAKALTDKRRQEGADAAQALAGHTTAQMTAHYTKAREVERVQPVPLKRAS
ncbi:MULTISPECIES: tyrosine-type recombinase/integrase [unclassified Paraburkholderia]|uniref:tyrosine-type recombinase/integrase n=1 Tax=unclassified Paraburkholderia TaxID=2615204 RepID=UPI0017FC68B8|nr:MULTISPECIES: tyrosine-type recombinase/integrase [unclassified Paraburkholderia]MBB5443249.1 integrase [Paraburkholderia sp. WSM4177]MBB5483145.1 integrase [Paraburkholderia sp. WSM4180]